MVLGTIGSTMFFGNALGCILIGRASDLWGRKLVLLISMLGCIGSLIWMLFIDSMMTLYLTLFLYGFFNGVRSITAYALAVELVSL
jgi:MFS family permease